ncbi:MAG: GNAT family N-acetyltransferase [Acidimicrobiales bacterium]
MSPDRSDEEVFEAMLERTRRTVRAIADRVEDVEGGFVASTPSLPVAWTLNRLHLTRSASVEAATALADRYLSDRDFRHIVVEHDQRDRLSKAFADADWAVEREVHMVLGAAPAPLADQDEIVELRNEECVELTRMWIEEDHPDLSAGGVGQLVEMTAREGRWWRERVFGIRAGGRAVSMTKLRTDDEVAWVEDVYTDPAARRRGLARRLVTHVTGLAAASGRDFVYIIADASDWPQHLYGEIGFRPVGYLKAFHRSVPPAQA